jgi:hypothetical protein
MVAQAPQVDPEATPAREGEVVLYCVVEISNSSSTPFTYDQADFELLALPWVSYGGERGLLATVSEPPFLSGTLEPGETLRRAIPFELAPEALDIEKRLSFRRLERTTSATVLVVVEWGPR